MVGRMSEKKMAEETLTEDEMKLYDILVMPELYKKLPSRLGMSEKRVKKAVDGLNEMGKTGRIRFKDVPYNVFGDFLPKQTVVYRTDLEASLVEYLAQYLPEGGDSRKGTMKSLLYHLKKKLPGPAFDALRRYYLGYSLKMVVERLRKKTDVQEQTI